MARISRRRLEELRRIVGAPEECQDCKGVHYIGVPKMFVYLYLPKPTGDTSYAGTHRKGTDEEFERYFNGCPTCGEQVRTVPIVMTGLVAPNVHGRAEVPDPWPVREWPPIPDSVKKPVVRGWG
jgi:hypothetical protein